MTNAKSTKRALVTSALAVLMCVAMLIGTTFAWFTDTASTAVNKIQAGNLKIALLDSEGNDLTKDGEKIQWKVKNEGNKKGEDGKTYHLESDVLWEPGCTFRSEYFYIKNEGNLALKYKLNISFTGGDTKLLEALEFSGALVADTLGTKTFNSLEELNSYEGYLLPEKGADQARFNINVHMKEKAGNEYQGLNLGDMNITVVATQYTYEYDSTGKDYDKNATYPVANADELKSALTAGGIVNVATDLPTNNSNDSADARMVINAPTTLNLDKKIISPDNMGDNNDNFAALYVDADTTINAGKDGGIDTGSNGGYGINVRNGATLTINGGYYYGGGTAVQVQKGTLVINGGTFACEPFSGSYGYNFLINCIDSAYKDGTAVVEIKGGTFVNFDPSNCKAEGAGTNFVADGYKVVAETQSNGDVWYTVVAE